jgi:hypothetical protein
VIYSLDARGLVASLSDASTEARPDPSGRLHRSEMGEVLASQDAMHALAADTGGKATFNINTLERGLSRALKETSVYYLLAWKPEEQNQRSSKFRRIEVKVIGKPNLTVHVRRGFFDREPEAPTASTTKTKAPPTEAKDNAPVNPSETALRKAIFAPYPDRDIPVSLSLSYIDTPNKRAMLTADMEVPCVFFSFQPVEGKM